MAVECAIPEHVARKRGPCDACGQCRICPLRDSPCEPFHIGSANATKKSEANKRKRRKSGGTPQRDAARTLLLHSMRCAASQLTVRAEESARQTELPAVRKIPLVELEQAATVLVQQLISCIMDVSEWEDEAAEEKNVLLRIVGNLTISKEAGTTVAESVELVSNLTKLAISGSANTKRYTSAIMSESLSHRRCQEVLSSLVAAHDATTQLGKTAFSSRRKDFKMLTSGLEMEPRLGFVRLKKGGILGALTFIQNNCDLSWRNGHIVSRVIGTEKVEMPRLRRHLTLEFLFGEYGRWCSEQSLDAIGRQQFYSLARLITVEVREVTGASYYFTDGVIESFKIIKELLTRLRAIVVPDSASAVDRLIKRAATLQYFAKYDLRSHLDADIGGSPEGFHCVRHAVNGECTHDHHFTCSSCFALDQLGDEIVEHIKDFLRNDDAHIDELDSMIACVKRASLQIHRYVKHSARAMWQHARIAGAMISVARDPLAKNSVLFVDLDHKQKVLGRKLVENQIEYFGKVGMSLLGAMVMSAAADDTGREQSSVAEGTSVSLHFYDMVVTNGGQDLFQVISCLEALICHLHEQFPDVDRIVLISDNASVFTGGDWIPWIVKLTRRYPFLRISRYMNTEAQTGRDMLDAHFSFLNKLIDGFVRKDNAVQCPEQLYAALTAGGGVANTTTLLVDVDLDKAALYNNSKRSFSTKIKSGLRKVHDTVYDDACVSVCVGSTPLCRIYTNSEVPNSVMTATLSKPSNSTPDPESTSNLTPDPEATSNPTPGPQPMSNTIRIPRYICPDTFAEQIVAAVVEKTLSSEPHSIDVPMKYATTTGVITAKCFTSPKQAVPLKKLLSQPLTDDRTGDDTELSTLEAETVRCSQCSKRYTRVEDRDRHAAGCTEYVVRDKDELIAKAVREFFTSSKQTFVETRARAVSVEEHMLEAPERRSLRNWADKESKNDLAVLPDNMKNAIHQFYVKERASGRKVQPQQVAEHLFASIVSPTDWNAKYLLSEQRLKSELSRLSRS